MRHTAIRHGHETRRRDMRLRYMNGDDAEKSYLDDALGAFFGAKLGATEVSDPGMRRISRTRTLLLWLGGPMG